MIPWLKCLLFGHKPQHFSSIAYRALGGISCWDERSHGATVFRLICKRCGKIWQTKLIGQSVAMEESEPAAANRREIEELRKITGLQ